MHGCGRDTGSATILDALGIFDRGKSSREARNGDRPRVEHADAHLWAQGFWSRR
jgi:hypothetical protein